MTRSSKPAKRNPTPAIANRIGGRVFFQTFMDCAPDYESVTSLIADMPPRLAATEVGMEILVLLWPGRVLPCRASPNAKALGRRPGRTVISQRRNRLPSPEAVCSVCLYVLYDPLSYGGWNGKSN